VKFSATSLSDNIYMSTTHYHSSACIESHVAIYKHCDECSDGRHTS